MVIQPFMVLYYRLGHGTEFMNIRLNPDFSESGLDFKNPITSLSGLKQISKFEFKFLASGLNLDKSNQIPDQG